VPIMPSTCSTVGVESGGVSMDRDCDSDHDRNRGAHVDGLDWLSDVCRCCVIVAGVAGTGTPTLLRRTDEQPVVGAPGQIDTGSEVSRLRTSPVRWRYGAPGSSGGPSP